MDLPAQIEVLKRGCAVLVSEAELSRKLSLGRALRVKLGVDPTSADLHLGHSVVLTKLRAFQDLGHTAVLIIGDFTALIGDPSGRDATRPTLSPQEIASNARTYQEQAFKILDPKKSELRFNSEWLKAFVREQLLETLKRHTVQQVLAREDFKARVKENSPLTLLEVLYPLLQGHDSVAVRADVELGGNDQLTNLLMGRRMQQDAGQEPQVALTMPLLVGTEGVKKMSKSYGNAIALNDPQREMFGKIMKLSDELMMSYYELLTGEDLAGRRSQHPMQAKLDLAELLTGRYHGPEAARAERGFFDETFSQKKLPEDLKTHQAPRGIPLSKLVAEAGEVKLRNRARRLIEQGGIKIDGRKVTEDKPVDSPPSFVLQIGKHEFVRVRLT